MACIPRSAAIGPAARPARRHGRTPDRGPVAGLADLGSAPTLGSARTARDPRRSQHGLPSPPTAGIGHPKRTPRPARSPQRRASRLADATHAEATREGSPDPLDASCRSEDAWRARLPRLLLHRKAQGRRRRLADHGLRCRFVLRSGPGLRRRAPRSRHRGILATTRGPLLPQGGLSAQRVLTDRGSDSRAPSRACRSSAFVTPDQAATRLHQRLRRALSNHPARALAHRVSPPLFTRSHSMPPSKAFFASTTTSARTMLSHASRTPLDRPAANEG